MEGTQLENWKVTITNSTGWRVHWLIALADHTRRADTG